MHSEAGRQGDQIGRIFAHWAIVYFGQFFENDRRSLNFLATFFHDENFVFSLTEIGCATFWAILSQTHLVTLLADNGTENFRRRKET
jgi:hypothetical protein